MDERLNSEMHQHLKDLPLEDSRAALLLSLAEAGDRWRAFGPNEFAEVVEATYDDFLEKLPEKYADLRELKRSIAKRETELTERINTLEEDYARSEDLIDLIVENFEEQDEIEGFLSIDIDVGVKVTHSDKRMDLGFDSCITSVSLNEENKISDLLEAVYSINASFFRDMVDLRKLRDLSIIRAVLLEGILKPYEVAGLHPENIYRDINFDKRKDWIERDIDQDRHSVEIIKLLSEIDYVMANPPNDEDINIWHTSGAHPEPNVSGIYKALLRYKREAIMKKNGDPITRRSLSNKIDEFFSISDFKSLYAEARRQE